MVGLDGIVRSARVECAGAHEHLPRQADQFRHGGARRIRVPAFDRLQNMRVLRKGDRVRHARIRGNDDRRTQGILDAGTKPGNEALPLLARIRR